MPTPNGRFARGYPVIVTQNVRSTNLLAHRWFGLDEYGIMDMHRQIPNFLQHVCFFKRGEADEGLHRPNPTPSEPIRQDGGRRLPSDPAGDGRWPGGIAVAGAAGVLAPAACGHRRRTVLAHVTSVAGTVFGHGVPAHFLRRLALSSPPPRSAIAAVGSGVFDRRPHGFRPYDDVCRHAHDTRPQQPANPPLLAGGKGHRRRRTFVDHPALAEWPQSAGGSGRLPAGRPRAERRHPRAGIVGARVSSGPPFFRPRPDGLLLGRGSADVGGIRLRRRRPVPAAKGDVSVFGQRLVHQPPLVVHERTAFRPLCAHHRLFQCDGPRVESRRLRLFVPGHLCRKRPSGAAAAVPDRTAADHEPQVVIHHVAQHRRRRHRHRRTWTHPVHEPGGRTADRLAAGGSPEQTHHRSVPHYQ